MTPREPTQIAPGVHGVAVGRGIGASNVYFVRSGPSWVLVDAGWGSSGPVIWKAAESLYGVGTRPASIMLTHLHPDHMGSVKELAAAWGVPAHVHPDELPMAAGGILPQYANPLDRWLVAPLLRLLPRHRRERMLDEGSLVGVVSGLDPQAGLPGLPDWECVPTRGHTPGHVAFFRSSDRVLLTGDAALTVNLNPMTDRRRDENKISGPPWVSTWDWRLATESIAVLAALEPRVVATGHGRPVVGAQAAPALAACAAAMARTVGRTRASSGFFRSVDYTCRTSYRRPPTAYLRAQWLGPLATRLGISPGYVVTLEVPGRRSGVIRRTTLVQVTHDGERYLVALAGESEWVRNVRAAGGRVVLGRKERYAATLVEVPAPERAPVIRSYLLRAGRRPASTAVTNEARHYFGVSADPTLEEIEPVVERYPVFRVVASRPR